MEILRHILVFLHIVGFALIFGSLAYQAAEKQFRFTKITDWGLVLALLTGIILTAPFGDFDPNYIKIGVKLIILIALGAVLGIGSAQQRRTGEPVAPPLFWVAFALPLVNAAIAVIWT